MWPCSLEIQTGSKEYARGELLCGAGEGWWILFSLLIKHTEQVGKYTAQRTVHKCPHLYNCTQEKKWNMTKNTERQPLCPLLGTTPRKDNY